MSDRLRSRLLHPRADSIASGTGVLVTARMITAVLGWAGTVAIVRTLSPSAWGGFSLIFSLMGLVGALTDFRLGRVVLRGIMDAGDRAGHVLGNYVVFRTLLGVLAYVAVLTVVVVGDYPSVVVRGAALAGTVLLLSSITNALDVGFQSRLWMLPIALGWIVGQVVQLALTLVIAFGGWGSLITFAIPAIAFEVVCLGVKVVLLTRHSDIRLGSDVSSWWEWSKEAAPLAVGQAMVIIYFRVDQVMLSAIKGLSAVGVYAIGYKFSDLIGFLPWALMTPTTALMVRAWPEDLAAFRAAFQRALELSIVLAVGLSIGFCAFSAPLIETLYGARYEIGSTAARLLVVGQGLHFFTALCLGTLIAVRRNRLYPVAALTGLGVNVGLNLVLIPRYSYNGAGWATVCTETLVIVGLVLAVRRVPGLGSFPWSVAVKTVVAGAVTFAVAFALDAFSTPWPLAATLAAACYLGVLHLVRTGGPGGLRDLVRDVRESFETEDGDEGRGAG